MSPEERIVKLETSQPYIMEKIENIERLVIELKKDLQEALNNKADKWVENILKLIGVLVVTGFITYIGTLIYQATVHLAK